MPAFIPGSAVARLAADLMLWVVFQCHVVGLADVFFQMILSLHAGITTCRLAKRIRLKAPSLSTQSRCLAPAGSHGESYCSQCSEVDFTGFAQGKLRVEESIVNKGSAHNYMSELPAETGNHLHSGTRRSSHRLRFRWKSESKSGYSLETRRSLRPMEETVFQPVTVIVRLRPIR